MNFSIGQFIVLLCLLFVFFGDLTELKKVIRNLKHKKKGN